MATMDNGNPREGLMAEKGAPVRRSTDVGRGAGHWLRGLSVGLLCTACVSLGLGARTASAEPPARAFDSQIEGGEGGFVNVQGIGFDGAGHLWIVDDQVGEGPARLQRGIYKYSPYPSGELLSAPTVPAVFSLSREMHLSVDQATDEVLVSQSNGRRIFFFKEDAFTREWNKIDDIYGNQYGIDVAVDNSQTASRGRVYLSLTSPENFIEVLESAQRPVELPASASYIEGNRITGTPQGPFGEVGRIAVGDEGNLFVDDIGEGVVDEFDSSGTFLRTFPNLGALAVDPLTGDVIIGYEEYDPSGNLLGILPPAQIGQSRENSDYAFNSAGYLYVPSRRPGYEHLPDPIEIIGPAPKSPQVTYQPVSSPTLTSGTLNASVDLNGGGEVTECQFEYGEAVGNYSIGSLPCEASSVLPYGDTTAVSARISALTTGTTYHYRVAVRNARVKSYGTDQTYIPEAVLALSTDLPSAVSESGATLNGSFVGNGEDTHYYFEWGRTVAYGNTTAAAPGEDAGAPIGPVRTSLSTAISGLSPYTTYHYRVVASNQGGALVAHGTDQMFTTPPGIPSIADESASQVHSDRADLHGLVDPNGAETSYQFEYVDDANYQQSGYANAQMAPGPSIEIGRGKKFMEAEKIIHGLTPGTLYHYRVVGTNDAGVGTPSSDRTFKTYPFTEEINDPCPNAHVRQQTGSALAMDCRAYELVSATDSGGYDVESSIVAGQTPFGGYPEAESPPRVLYGIHDGALSVGSPTNHGIDPYVATRGQNGWTTEYVGIPAAGSPSSSAFASTLLEADSSLDVFAFGGKEICSPCFADGSAGEPVHLPGGQLVQGMSGSEPQPTAEPAAFIGKHLSADGSHLVFGATAPFEPDGNEGELSIYDRNLNTKVTHVVSKTPAGATMTGSELGELDISTDGSRIVIGELISESAGQKYWHLYMNIGDSNHTIDLTPGTTAGVAYDGMTADGSRVFFSTTDQLTGDDEDTSTDLYAAQVTGSTATLSRVSTGTAGAGNSNACDPAADTKHVHWNVAGSEETCGVLVIGGGGGVASEGGSIFFLSPEKLDGPSNGTFNAPNLYVGEPGSQPRFVATLESTVNAPLPVGEHAFRRDFGSFAKPAGVAIDHSTGDVYVLDIGNEFGESPALVQKFDSGGHAITTFGQGGKIEVAGSYGAENIPTEMAIDQTTGNIYVPNLLGGIVEEFDSSGKRIEQISIGGLPTGVGVDPTDGKVYVTNYFGGVKVYSSAGVPLTSFPTLPQPMGVAVNSSGTVFVVNGGGPAEAKGVTEMYSSTGTDLGPLDEGHSVGVAVDPSDDHVYVDEEDRVLEFDGSGHRVNVPIGEGRLSGSIGLAVDSGVVDVSDRGSGDVETYDPAALPPDPAIDNPLVIDGVSFPGKRMTGDFQVTPSGAFAVFTSSLPLTGYDNADHREIFRYSAQDQGIECSSCNPTGARAIGDSALAGNGLSLTDDGRVFFDSDEGLVDRDVNDKPDAYEWESGQEPQLISTGTGAFASNLLSVSANGEDAYFFTRDKLTQQDKNGNTVRIYDAREMGGIPYAPQPEQCKASDECHGPGSVAPPPPAIRSIAGSPESRSTGAFCKRGFVKKHGSCVRRRSGHGHHAHHRKHRRSATATNSPAPSGGGQQ